MEAKTIGIRRDQQGKVLKFGMSEEHKREFAFYNHQTKGWPIVEV